MAENTIERKVYFFRLDVLPNEDGSVPSFSIEDALRSIQGLRFERTSTGPRSRYADTHVGLLCAWPSLARDKIRLRFGRVRRDDLPRLENAGSIKPLPIGPTDGIVETTHMQFFDHNIVGVEFNYHGPRASALSTYCETKVPDLPHFRLRPLLNRDALRQLDNMEDMRLVSIRLHPSDAQLLAEANRSLPAAFQAVGQQYNANAIDFVLRAEPRRTLDRSIFEMVRTLFRSSRNPLDDFDVFKLKGRSADRHRVEEFDLLRDKLIATEVVAKMPGRTRAVDENSMFAGIEDAYNSLVDDLHAAAGVSLTS